MEQCEGLDYVLIRKKIKINNIINIIRAHFFEFALLTYLPRGDSTPSLLFDDFSLDFTPASVSFFFLVSYFLGLKFIYVP
jgi:hypothetical protein